MNLYDHFFKHLSLNLAAVFFASTIFSVSDAGAENLPKLHAQVGEGPLKVYIMAGQSNMDGQANIRTVDFLGEDKDPAKAAMLKVFKPDGKSYATRDDVWVANVDGYDKLQPGFGGRGNYNVLGENIGPEYAFSDYMSQALDEPVLLIKHTPDGQNYYVNFRPPSAGVPVGMKPEEVGTQYRILTSFVHETLNHLKEKFPSYQEKVGYEIAGFVWFQGYNDLFNDTGRKEYGQNVVHLIKDLRTEFMSPNMKTVVGVMGVNGIDNEFGKQKEVRDGHRFINTANEFKGNVKAIESAPFLHPDIVAIKTAGWLNMRRDMKKNLVMDKEQALLNRATSSQGYHYNGEGRFFILLGKAFADTMLELSGKKDKVVIQKLNDLTSPKSLLRKP